MPDVPVYPLMVGHEERVEEFNFQMRLPAPAGMNASDFETRQNYFRTKFEEKETQTVAFLKLGDATGGRAFDPPTLDAANAPNHSQSACGRSARRIYRGIRSRARRDADYAQGRDSARAAQRREDHGRLARGSLLV